MTLALYPFVLVLAFFIGGDLIRLGNPILLTSMAAVMLMSWQVIRARGHTPWSFLLAWALILTPVALASIRVDCPPSHWWRIWVWTLTACTALSWAERQRQAYSILAVLAIGGSCTVALSAIITAAISHFGFRTTELYGFPNINVGINAIGPLVLVGSTWAFLRTRSTPKRIGWGLCLMPVLATCIITGRRGLLAAAAITLAIVYIAHCWNGRRQRAVLIIAILVTAIPGYAIHALSNGSFSPTGLRLIYYQAGLDSLLHPQSISGYGAYPMFHLMDAPWDSARFLAAHSTFTYHAHSEPLEMVLSGGIGTALGILFLATLIVRHINQEPGQRRYGKMALASMYGILATIDPSYSEPSGALFLGIALGLCSAPSPGKNLVPSAVRSALGIGCSILLVGHLAMIFRVDRNAAAKDQLRPCLQLGDPELTLSTCRPLLEQVTDPRERLSLILAVQQHTGWIGPLLADGESAAWDARDTDAVITFERRMLFRSPLYLEGHLRLQEMQIDPSTVLDPFTATIHNLLSGKIRPDHPPTPPYRIREAYLATAALMSRHLHNVWEEGDDRCAQAIATRWGPLHDVANILVQIGLHRHRVGWLGSCRAQLVYGIGSGDSIASLIKHTEEGKLAGLFEGLDTLWPNDRDRPSLVQEALQQRSGGRPPQTH